ncbi:MAG: alpha-mannosidase [Acidimicrobiales bacterium]
MHDEREHLEARIARARADLIPALVERDAIAFVVRAGDQPDPGTHEPFAIGTPWGPPWGTTWFTFDATMPAHWAEECVEASIDLGAPPGTVGFSAEGLVVDHDGRPRHGLHPRRHHVTVPARPGPVRVRVEAASNPTFHQFVPSPLGDPATAGTEPLYRLRRADLVLVDTEARALARDVEVLDEMMRTLALDDPRRARLRSALVQCLDALPDVAAARAVLAPALALPARASAHRIVAVGHAHIDTAWLWPIRETVRKCIRTFASAVDLMDEAPDFRFACSQAQQLQWVADAEPELFERIATAVAAGQWIPVGGMWVEADMNLPSGESLARQIVEGQRWFEKVFGRRCTEVWIPDVFGYPAGLPQLFAAGGMTRFVTQKLSWNKQNRFPHHTFWWEGLDGTRVLTHFPSVDTYNSSLHPAELAHASSSFAEQAWSDWSLAPFGYGDGGGGPTIDMIERARRMADLDGAPRVEIDSPARFFAEVEAEAAAGAPVPVWRGELYFETHRGTLTSQLRTKVGNRRCERLLREAELWAATASVDLRLGPLWREVLTQQFHDILPGSSIAWVHADTEAVHRRVAAELERRIVGVVGPLAPAGAALANVDGHGRDEVVVTDGAPVAGSGPVQLLGDGRLAYRAVVPALGVAAAVAQDTDDEVAAEEGSLRNGRLSVALDGDGWLSSVIDLVTGREVLAAGRAGAVVEIAADHPVEYDAWDLERWTRDGGQAIDGAAHVEVLEQGPLVGRVRATRSFGSSSIAVTYELRAGSRRLDIGVDLDWHESEAALSMAFPLDLRTDTARCDVQFGAVERPVHRSTSWDDAKFEVCAHRFVDLAEHGFGVAVLNDGRYGHGLDGSTVRVTLARAARYPDPAADQGRHRVTLALLAHDGDRAEVLRQACALNLPLRSFVGTGGAVAGPVVAIDGMGVELDAVKRADDGTGDLIVRLHEALGGRSEIALRSPEGITTAWRCPLTEEPAQSVEVTASAARLTLRPYELVTLRLHR